MSQDNVTAVQKMYAAFAKGDIPTVLATLDPNVHFTFQDGRVVRFQQHRTVPGSG